MKPLSNKRELPSTPRPQRLDLVRLADIEQDLLFDSDYLSMGYLARAECLLRHYDGNLYLEPVRALDDAS